MKITVSLLLIVSLGFAEWSVPILMANHLYVEKNPFYTVGDDVSDKTPPFQAPQQGSQMFKNTLEMLGQCLADAFIVVKVPNLQLEDFQQWESWGWSRQIVSKASTLISVSHMTDYEQFDFKRIEKVLRLKCSVTKIEIHDFEEPTVVKYIDSSARLIDVQIPDNALTFDLGSNDRKQQIKDIDDLIYKIVKKLPSPNIFIMIVSTTPDEFIPEEVKKDIFLQFNEIPQDPASINPSLKQKALVSKRWIWPDITIFDKSRWFGFERNKKYERVIKDKDEDDTWLEKKTKKYTFKGKNRFDINEDEFLDSTSSDDGSPHIYLNNFDTGLTQQFFIDNALYIVSAIALIVLLLFIKSITFLGRMLTLVVKSKNRRNNEVKHDLSSDNKKNK